MRKYYEYKYTTMRNGDANTGQDGEEELTSIRVDSSHPSAAEYPAGYYYHFYPQEEPMPGPHQTSGITLYHSHFNGLWLKAGKASCASMGGNTKIHTTERFTIERGQNGC